MLTGQGQSDEGVVRKSKALSAQFLGIAVVKERRTQPQVMIRWLILGCLVKSAMVTAGKASFTTLPQFIELSVLKITNKRSKIIHP